MYNGLKKRKRSMDIKVSIIVPVYNVELYLNKCIKSLLNQTLKEIEIILIDDGSTDKSGSICDEYAKIDNRITVLHKNNEGLGLTRNYGIKRAKGKYIGFVDSDDYVLEDMYEHLYNIAEKHRADVVFSSNCYRITNEGEIKKQKPNIEEEKIFVKDNIINELLPDIISSPPEYKSDGVIGVAVWKGLYNSKKIIENNIMFNSERVYISEDAIFQLDLIPKIEKAVITPYIGYCYRENRFSLSMKYKKDRFEMDKTLYYKQLQMIKTFSNSTLEERIERIFLANMRLCVFQEILNEKIPLKEKRINISVINKDELSRKILHKYPIKRLPFAKRIVCILQKYNLFILLYLLVKIKYRK